jgi:hypothetical protein
MKTLAERNGKTKNLGLPLKSEEKSPLFLSAKAGGSPFNFWGCNMVEHFKVINKGGQYVVRYVEGKVNVVSFPKTLDGYLRSKIRALKGNMIIAHAEEELQTAGVL